MMPSENISPEKAKKILKDKEVKGHPLTEKQKGMFGAAAGRAKKLSHEQQEIVDRLSGKKKHG